MAASGNPPYRALSAGAHPSSNVITTVPTVFRFLISKPQKGQILPKRQKICISSYF